MTKNLDEGHEIWAPNNHIDCYAPKTGAEKRITKSTRENQMKILKVR